MSQLPCSVVAVVLFVERAVARDAVSSPVAASAVHGVLAMFATSFRLLFPF
jgi:hypothetical protein